MMLPMTRWISLISSGDNFGEISTGKGVCAFAARQWQVRRLLTKVVAKFMSYDLQTSCLQKPENSRIV
jgi:hypothetical protein